MITVHIVDDHKILVEGLQKLVDESGFAKTTAVSYTGKECMTQLRREATRCDFARYKPSRCQRH